MTTTIESSPNSATSVQDQVNLDSPACLSEAARETGFWRKSAPKAIATKDSWSVWSHHLRKRKTPLPLTKLCNAAASPLGWGLAQAELAPRTAKLLELHEQLTGQAKGNARTRAEDLEQLLGEWLAEATSPPRTIDDALECLAVAHALPAAVESLNENLWWDVCDALWRVVQSAVDWRSDASLPPEQGLAQQMLAGELTLTLAYLFPEMRPVYKLRTTACDAISEGLNELLNGEGLLQGPYLAFLRPLVACWTRCRLLGEKMKKGTFSRKADEQLHGLTTHALGLSSPEGTSLLGEPHEGPWTADFLRSMLHLYNDTADISTARTLFKKKLTATLKGRQVNVVPETSDNCEWAGVAYMRTEWQRGAPTVAIDYSSPNLRLEVWAGTQRLIAGAWSWETTLNGKRLEPAGSWDETCWFSDNDVDYLELAIDLADGARLERQILLAREELFLLLADNVIGTAGGKLCHRYRLPRDSRIDFRAEKETREGLLCAAKPVARVLPLALPEWRSDPRIGQLTGADGRLQLEQEREGRNISCPLLIDLKKSRTGKPCTWRQLTVAQALEIQPHDVAVGYRAQCGKQQWLIYRSLAERANRSLLGQNVSLECLVARFLAPSGEIDELLEIE
ncbi:MAG: hypothetical protein MI725_08795 [Pirellulales bacterium]|nr:hypothetical protein [Pirellulales bacterium]